ncbi:NADH-cytochrome b5 reductase [Stylosanthes scabra]|uniref:NADH-cytochrome b5 reductase n=1 Tax=Stylosanthes scabra TaxID=79078 RepID=A0ABU6W7A8_9FABA|nr:NADH-cytochrome b5 reductase [Stylosanthes scabra]
MLELPILKMSFRLTKFDFSHFRYFAEKLQPELLGGAVAIVAVGLTAAYFYRRFTKVPKRCLDPNNFKEFELIKKTQLSHNSARFKFALPTPNSVLGLPVGKNILARGRDSLGEEVMRSYTPITLDSDVGYFELVVKMYPNGKMSHHFRQMKIGDKLEVKGPKGRFSYKPGQVRAFGMIAGGSGITPMFQITRAVLENPKDKTMIFLLYANVTVDDILLKPPNEWNGGVGYITKEMIQTHCPAPSNDIQILKCGPPLMNNAMTTYLNALGYQPKMQFQF